MNKLFVGLIAGSALVAAAISSALCAEIVGSVLDANGNAVPGVKLSTTTQDGRRIGNAITDDQGAYAIDGMSSGLYYITLAPPAGSALLGQSVASYVGDRGMTVNWAVAPGREPLASAMPGVHNGNPGISAIAAASKKDDPPPGCKGMPGPPCGPKKSKKRADD